MPVQRRSTQFSDFNFSIFLVEISENDKRIMGIMGELSSEANVHINPDVVSTLHVPTRGGEKNIFA